MEFSKKKFLEIANKHEKRIFARFLDEIEGKEVDFGGSYGTVYLDAETYIYPVYREWCE